MVRSCVAFNKTDVPPPSFPNLLVKSDDIHGRLTLRERIPIANRAPTNAQQLPQFFTLRVARALGEMVEVLTPPS